MASAKIQAVVPSAAQRRELYALTAYALKTLASQSNVGEAKCAPRENVSSTPVMGSNALRTSVPKSSLGLVNVPPLGPSTKSQVGVMVVLLLPRGIWGSMYRSRHRRLIKVKRRSFQTLTLSPPPIEAQEVERLRKMRDAPAHQAAQRDSLSSSYSRSRFFVSAINGLSSSVVDLRRLL